MKRLLLPVCLALALRLTGAEPARPFVSPLIGEHMMLQRGQPNRLWGWTDPGAKIHAVIAGHEASGVAASNGRWQVLIDPPAAGGPYTLTIDGPQHLEFHDVLVGDLWICSGQSNMEFGLGGAKDGAEAVKNSTHPGIRLFRVGQQSAYGSDAQLRGEWRVCAPAAFTTGGGLSAVAYYFGRKIHEATGVPIGLVQAAVGGSPAESWITPETLGRMPEFAAPLAEIAHLRARGGPAYGSFLMHWLDEFDGGLAGGSWAAPAFDDAAWKPVSLKTGFADLGLPTTPAVAWFRRELTLPDPLPAGTAHIQLGVVEKMDTVWLNGRWTGASSWVENPRNYAVPEGTLHPGRNVVALRVFKLKPDGGFQSPADQLRIVLGDGTVVPLEGAWKAAVSVDARPPHSLPLSYENYPTMPTALYLGMLRPLGDLAVTGALWYQGEANFTRAAQYRTLLPALIADWRALFGRPELPFYVVSLPAFMARRDQPGSDGWTDLREAQALTVRNVAHTGLAITVDTGDANNIHPTEKQPVGERLARLALKDVYKQDVVSAGPTFARLEPMPGALRVRFTHTDGGLVVKGERLGEFSVAGADRVWHWAEARLDGETVVVSSSAVPEPVTVRYAWQANPLATLYNGAGLPAAPFRSDDW